MSSISFSLHCLIVFHKLHWVLSLYLSFNILGKIINAILLRLHKKLSQLIQPQYILWYNGISHQYTLSSNFLLHCSSWRLLPYCHNELWLTSQPSVLKSPFSSYISEPFALYTTNTSTMYWWYISVQGYPNNVFLFK